MRKRDEDKAKPRSQTRAKRASERQVDASADLRREFLLRLRQLRKGFRATAQTESRIRNWQNQFRKNLRSHATASRAWKEILAARLDQDAAGLLYLYARPVVFQRVTHAFGKGSTFYSIMRQRIRAANSEREQAALRSLRKEILSTAGPRSTFDRYQTLLFLQAVCARRGVKLGLKRLAGLVECADPEKSRDVDPAYLGRLLRNRADVLN